MTTAVSGPSDAELARTLIAAAPTAALSTIGEGGFPFGSLVTHAVDAAGRPLLLLSDLAEHTRNLVADPRASLMAVQDGAGDPLALGRVTVVGEVSVLGGDERTATLTVYRDTHPDAFYADPSTIEDHGFRIYRLDVASVRYVGGFGRMSWVDAAAYTAAEPDPLRPHAAGIVEHMNDDHADSLALFARVFGGREQTVEARMVGCDRYGFAMLTRDTPGGEEKDLRLPFRSDVATPDAARAAMVELVREARG